MFNLIRDGDETIMKTASFTVAELRDRQQKSGEAWLEFLDLASMSMGVYYVAAGTNDRETHEPHARDEVYVGIAGAGRLTAGGKVFDIEAGAIIYVKAGIEHFFHDVTDDLTILVFFPGSKI